jgi:release factor glutamine methyltransferase
MDNKNLHEEYRRGKNLLDESGYADGTIDARVLLCHAAGITKEQLFARGNELTLTEQQRENYTDMLRKRLTREPVASIMGCKEFMGLEFKVDRSVLIPRPATETLVELALSELGKYSESENSDESELLIADIGCGSGNISVSMAYFNNKVRVYAVDISYEALEVARENISKLDRQVPGKFIACRIHLLAGNLLEPVPECRKNSFRLILSNPPYVTEEEWENLMDGVKLYEPRIALVPPEGAEEIYRKLAENALDYLTPGGSLMVETGAYQAELVTGIFKKAGYDEVCLFKDLEGFDRVVTGKKPVLTGRKMQGLS